MLRRAKFHLARPHHEPRTRAPRRVPQALPRPKSISSDGTPTTCARAPAGFVKGPRRLKTVRTPISLRAGAARRAAACAARAKKKPIPISRIALPKCSTGKSIFTPSASITSAEPLPVCDSCRWSRESRWCEAGSLAAGSPRTCVEDSGHDPGHTADRARRPRGSPRAGSKRVSTSSANSTLAFLWIGHFPKRP